MANFKVTFGYYFASPDEDMVPSREHDPVSYLVIATDESTARTYAERFKGLDLQYCEGLTTIKSIEEITEGEAKDLRPLSNLEALLAMSTR